MINFLNNPYHKAHIKLPPKHVFPSWALKTCNTPKNMNKMYDTTFIIFFTIIKDLNDVISGKQYHIWMESNYYERRMVSVTEGHNFKVVF